jgi:hypothetical protein
VTATNAAGLCHVRWHEGGSARSAPAAAALPVLPPPPPPTKPGWIVKLEVARPEGPVGRLELGPMTLHQRVTFGRAPACDVVLEHPSISRLHAPRVSLRPVGGWWRAGGDSGCLSALPRWQLGLVQAGAFLGRVFRTLFVLPGCGLLMRGRCGGVAGGRLPGSDHLYRRCTVPGTAVVVYRANNAPRV